MRPSQLTRLLRSDRDADIIESLRYLRQEHWPRFEMLAAQNPAAVLSAKDVEDVWYEAFYKLRKKALADGFDQTKDNPEGYFATILRHDWFKLVAQSQRRDSLPPEGSPLDPSEDPWEADLESQPSDEDLQLYAQVKRCKENLSPRQHQVLALWEATLDLTWKQRAQLVHPSEKAVNLSVAFNRAMETLRDCMGL